jgi:Skp family chaperone for outer membrane proteins
VQAIDAQTSKLGFIDMEYILQNVPDYWNKAQLEQKTEKWKLEIDAKKKIDNKQKSPKSRKSFVN